MIRCRYTRWRLACLIDEQEVPHGKLLGHVQTCGRCRAFYETQRAVSEALLQEATPLAEIDPGDVDYGIGFGDRSPQPRRPIGWVRRGLRTGAIAAGLLVLGYLGANHYRRIPSRQASAGALMGAVTVPSELAANWMSNSGTWMESPYTREVELLTSEAGRAVRFLAKCTVNPLTITAGAESAVAETQPN